MEHTILLYIIKKEVSDMYREVIFTAFKYFPLLALVMTLPYVFHNYRKYGSIKSVRVLVIYSFALYLLCCYFLVILPLPTIEEAAAMTGPWVQLVPFEALRDITQEMNGAWTVSNFVTNRAVLQALFNVVMTIPFGMYLRYWFRCSLLEVLVYSFLLSLFFELTQLTGLYFIYPRGYRLFDVDDLICNTLGGLMGYIMVGAVTPILPNRQKVDEDSIALGKKVPGTRRIIAHIIDTLCTSLVTSIICHFINFPYAWFILPFMMLVLVSVCTGGCTVGKAVMKLKVCAAHGKMQVWRYVVRYGFLAVMLDGGAYVSKVSLAGVSWMAVLSKVDPVITGFCVMVFYALLLFSQFLCVMQHRPALHEKISGTIVVSTIV